MNLIVSGNETELKANFQPFESPFLSSNNNNNTQSNNNINATVDSSSSVPPNSGTMTHFTAEEILETKKNLVGKKRNNKSQKYLTFGDATPLANTSKKQTEFFKNKAKDGDARLKQKKTKVKPKNKPKTRTIKKKKQKNQKRKKNLLKTKKEISLI